MSTQEDITRRIGNLLKKAEGTDNDHEAEAFFAKAYALMVEHEISEMQARLAAGGNVKPDEIIRHQWHFSGTMSSALASMATNIGYGLGFMPLIRKDRSNMYLTWYGFETDIKDAIVLFNSLQIQGARLQRVALQAEIRRRGGMDRQSQFKFKRSFLEGFGQRVAARIKESRTQAYEAAEGGSLLPALIDKNKQVVRHVETIFPNMKFSRRSSQHNDFSGRSAGRSAGDKADIGQRQMANRKALGQ